MHHLQGGGFGAEGRADRGTGGHDPSLSEAGRGLRGTGVFPPGCGGNPGGDRPGRTIRSDVYPGDVLAGLSGVSLAAADPAQHDLAGRLLDLLMDGLRHRAAG
ncbi:MULTISPECIES: SbtR family transcriptional regulator [unclassified Micromonospora]|uniref:SbtR family transcriptional regulator n=1 Tax=unclassified Micromonospora TaxID=2617518 RepID=UPI002FF33AF5